MKMVLFINKLDTYQNALQVSGEPVSPCERGLPG